MRCFIAALMLCALCSPALADRSYPCWVVRLWVNSHSKAELSAMEKKYSVTEEEKRAHAACFKKGKK